MTQQHLDGMPEGISSLSDLADYADYSLMDNLRRDPDATETGIDHHPRQVFSGHYVPVKPTPIADPQYVAHSKSFFRELGLDDSLAETDGFRRLFSGDVSQLPEPLRKTGWATGYALSIYGTEYTQQCPFQTGNGYGDGRAVSVLETEIKGKRWEMQLKGGGRTPYCRGADGRAVLRSSVREFLAQEHMHSLGVPTSRSLCLFASKTERVMRPWYSPGSQAMDPDTMVSNPVAITTRVAPSFLRVGQIELFGRRARKNEHANAMQELEMIVAHLLEREYATEIDASLPLPDKLIMLATLFRDRLTALVSHWIRVGYCQGNFNSDNCAAGGYTLDYGPFGFCEMFDPFFQPWTGGGRHFSFFNQPQAAETNFHMFCLALRPLIDDDAEALRQLELVRESFPAVMQARLEEMWAAKFGLLEFDEDVYLEAAKLMAITPVDYTIFFRELSDLPESVAQLQACFYRNQEDELLQRWNAWLETWNSTVRNGRSPEELSRQMKTVNPKYSWREWLIAPAYQQAEFGDYALIEALQEVLTKPYEEQGQEVQDKYYRLRPQEFFQAGGVSHYSCSS